MSEELIWAVKNGDLEAIKAKLSVPGVDVNKEILNGRAALHHAADYGQSEAIEYLLSKGADINRLDKHGITALLAAIYENHTECVKLLLDKGASKDLKAPDGSSYLECAESDDIKCLLK
ncbi:myotrophin-like [Glandiceps talaboti]